MPGRSSIRTITTTSVALLVLAFLIVAAPHLSAKSSGPQRISGEVMVKERGEDGEVLSVSIWDGTWGLVGVEMKGKGRELLAHVGDAIEATGTIEPAKGEDSVSFIIRLKTYKVQTPRQAEGE